MNEALVCTGPYKRDNYWNNRLKYRLTHTIDVNVPSCAMLSESYMCLCDSVSISICDQHLVLSEIMNVIKHQMDVVFKFHQAHDKKNR